MDAKITQLDVFPLVKYYLDQLKLAMVFQKYIKKGKAEIAPAEVLCMLITNIVISPRPLYQVDSWLAEYTDPKGEERLIAAKYNDDRLARALDKLFETDRHNLMTEISLQAIEVHHLNVENIHNDSTSVTFTGNYDQEEAGAVRLLPGYNKDHRPDLKQLVFGLNTTEDGNVPVGFQVFDGNRTDDTTHVSNWNQLRQLLQNEEFVYIADSKLSTTENMLHIHQHHGQFISVLPKTRKEVISFYRTIHETAIHWQDAYSKESSRKKGDMIHFKTFEKQRTKEGFRLIWVHSTAKEYQDRRRREEKIKKIESELVELSRKLNRYQLKTWEQITRAVKRSLKNSHALFRYQIVEDKTTLRIQNSRGKPGPNTQYREQEIISYHLEWEQNQEEIDKAASKDGIFPLVTNTDMEAKDVLKKYKTQPFLEKRFSLLKSVTNVAPVYIKKAGRIEAVMFLYFVALMIISLMERNIRKNMKEQKIKKLPIIPSSMKTEKPTWNNIKNYFQNVILLLIIHDTEKRAMIKGVSLIHSKMIELLGLPARVYSRVSEEWWRFNPG